MPTEKTKPTTLTLVHEKEIQTIPADYLSFTIDTSLIMGGFWWGKTKGLQKGLSSETVAPLDLENERLKTFAKALSPAMLRIGGTEADHVLYRSGRKAAGALGLLPTPEVEEKTPPAHSLAMGKGLWKRIHAFIEDVGFDLLFTVSAGPADRAKNNAWNEDSFLRLAAYCKQKKLNVHTWELGNEVNGFPYIHGFSHRVRPAQYSRDFARFASLARRIEPHSLCAGPSSAIWPRVGEPNPITKGLCKGPAAGFLDILTWHYYPLQSYRGRFATRRAKLHSMLKIRHLDECARIIRKMNRYIDHGNRCRAKHAEIQNWITETAHALYGGEPGLSDTFVSTLWWVDQLGLAAREGIQKIFRQSLIGSTYGLLNQENLSLVPDYYATFIWKKLIGEKVFCVEKKGAEKKLRLYVHSNKTGDGKILIAINISKKSSHILHTQKKPVKKFALAGSNGFQSSTITINGVIAHEDFILSYEKKANEKKYKLFSFTEQEERGVFTIPPLCIFFIELNP